MDVGPLVGMFVGAFVGIAVGTLVGPEVGVAVGAEGVGVAVGVGVGVGVDVGTGGVGVGVKPGVGDCAVTGDAVSAMATTSIAMSNRFEQKNGSFSAGFGAFLESVITGSILSRPKIVMNQAHSNTRPIP